MSVIVADACPVIFLAKADGLGLIPAVFPGRVLVPGRVRDELIQKTIPLPERQRILDFLGAARIETVRGSCPSATALSRADHQVLALAAKHPQSRILTDDSVVRRIAQAKGIPVTGTLGILIRAVRAGILTRPEALRTVEDLVARHQFRMTVELYQETVAQIRAGANAQRDGD